MKTIAIANQKGGCGKTATAAHLGVALARRGMRTLLVDMDAQGHLAEVLGQSTADLKRDISEVIDNRATLQEVMISLAENLDLVPATIRLSYVEAHLWTKLRREDRLRSALETVAERYDVAIVDTPPSLGLLTVNALAAADAVLVPMSCDYLSLLGVGLLLTTIEEMRREIRHELAILGVLPTRYAHTVNAREVMERARAELGNTAGLHIYEPIPETVRMREAAGAGVTIYDHAPDSPASVAYLKLAEEVASAIIA